MNKIILRAGLMDKKYKNMQDLEKIKAKKGIELAKLRTIKQTSTGNKGGGLLGQLGNLDLDQIGDIIDKVSDLKEGGDDEGGLLSLLNSPIVKGFLQAKQDKGNDDEDVPKEFKNVVFEQ